MANKSFSNVKVKVTHLDLSKDASRSVLVSGENISHSLGKIARWYKDIAWAGHTHTKSQITDFAHTHTSLDSSVDKGAENQPVYFVKGVPTAIAYTIKSSVPENAVFTDTNTKVTSVGNHYTPSGGTTTSASGGTLTDITNSANGIQVVTGVTKDAAGHVTGVTSIALKSVNSNTTYAAGTGISMGSGNVINHSNSITAVTTAAFKKFKYDAQGHITGTADVAAADLPAHTHSQYYDSGISRTANTVLAAPNGSTGSATFRKLAAADIPVLNYLPRAIYTTAQNADNLNTTGWFDLNVSNNTNIPTTNNGLLISEMDVGTKFQLWFPDNANTIYKRYYNISSSAWNNWVELKLTDTVYTHPSHTAVSSGLYKITVDSLGHVTGTAAVAAADLPSHTHSQYLTAHQSLDGRAINTTIPTNLNSATTPGFYNAQGGNTSTNKPTSDIDHYGLMTVHNAAGSYYTQIAFSDNKDYIRRCVNGTWGAWSEVKFTDTVYTHPSYTSKTSGLYKITVDATGHISGTASVTAADLPSHTHSYLPLSGGTMTGMLTLQANQYTDNYTTGGMDCKNSNIIGINSLVFADLADSAGEGLQFYRTATTVDSIWVKNGVMYFTPNRTLGSTATDYTIYHSGNLTLSTLGAAASSHTHDYTNPLARKNLTTSDAASDSKTDIANLGLSMNEYYNNTGGPADVLYGNIINVKGTQATGAGQLFLQWNGNDNTGDIYYRSHRDMTTAKWGAWKKVAWSDHIHSQYLTAHQDISGKVNKSGDTMSGNLMVQRGATEEPQVTVNNGSVKAGILVGSGKVNRGLYDFTTSQWMVYHNGTSVVLNGNANTATKLATARTINGVSFDGSANITVPRSIKHIHYAVGTSGTGGYVKICTVGTKAAYGDQPLRITIGQRKTSVYDIFIVFENSGAAKATIRDAYFRSNRLAKQTPQVHYYLNSDGYYDIYVTKSEAYDHIYIMDYVKSDGDEGNSVELTWTDTLVSTLPTGSVAMLNEMAQYYNTGSRTANTVLAAPNGSTGTATFRALVAADLPASGATAGSYGPSANASPAHSGTFSVPYLTVDAKGRVTAISTKTITLPASGNTDVNVTQSATTTTNYRPILSGATNVGTSGTGLDATITSQAYVSNMLFVQPSTGRLYARNLVAYNVDGGDVIVEWNRSVNASWRMVNTGGSLYLQCNYTTVKTDYYNAAKFNHNKGAVELYTGTLQIGNSDKASAGISFKTTNYTGAYLRVYDTGNAYNHDVVLNSTGSVMIGAGESASAIYDNNIESIKNSENMALSADGDIFIYTGANTINAHKRFKLTQGGNFGFTGMTGDWKRYCYWDGATGGTDSAALAPTSGLMRAGVWGYTSSIYTYFITGSDTNEHYFTANTYGIFAGCGSSGGAGGGDASTLTKHAGVVGVHNGKDAFYACIAAPSSLSNYVTCTLPNTSGTLALEGHTHSYLPLSGGKLTGALKIQTGSTNANVTYNDTVNPRLTFSNSNDSQYISLVYSDYDSYQAPDSLTLVGNQSGSYFIAPNIKATGNFYGSLSGNASTATTATTAKRLKYCTLCNESANAATYPWYRMAYAYSAGTYTDFNLVMMVTCGYGSKWGIFKARARIDGTAGTFGGTITIEWIVKHGFSNEQLYLLTKNNYQVDTAKSGTATVEIWFKSDGRYYGYTFTVLHEGWRTGTTSDLWALSSYTKDGAESYNKNVSSAKVSTSPSILAKTLKTATAVSNTGWTNNTTDDNIIPTMSFMAFWNGRYNSSSSNLQYCDRGRFGTIVTAGSGDFVKISKVLWTGTVATTARGEKSYTLANKATGYNIIKILYTSSTMSGGAAGCLEINGTKTAIPQPVVVGASATSTMQFYFKISSDGATITVGSNNEVITITGIYGLII